MSTTMEAARMAALLLRTLTSGKGHSQLACQWDGGSPTYSILVVRGSTKERLDAIQLNETSLVSLLARAVDHGDCFEPELPSEAQPPTVNEPADGTSLRIST